MTDPTAVQGDLASEIADIRQHRTLGPIFAHCTDAELETALRGLDSNDHTVLQICYGLGRPKGTDADVWAAVTGVNEVRAAYLAAGNRLLKLVEALALERLSRQQDELGEFPFKVHAMLNTAGIMSIPREGTFTEAQTRALIEQQPWNRDLTRSFNSGMFGRQDPRTLKDLVHPTLARTPRVRYRVRA